MIRRARLPVPVLPAAALVLAALALAGLAGFVPVAASEAVAVQGEAGRGALRPYVHVFAAYGIAWALILAWVWRIAKGLKRVEEAVGRDAGTR